MIERALACPPAGRRRSTVDERTGLIRWVLDLPIHPGEPRVFNCAVKLADTARYVGRPCYDNNGGCGLSRESARAAAVGEGLERYCASVYDPSEFCFGPAGAISRQHPVCPPTRYALFHPDQPVGYPRFTDDAPVAWVWGHSLMGGGALLVPACIVYMPYEPAFREQGEVVIAPAVSTGQACARSLAEALVRGICEVVERDAFMVTWLNRLPLPRVELSSHPALEQLYRQHLQRPGLRYVLLDMTSDIPIPSFLCLVIDEHRSPPMVCAGGATHLDPLRAATRALLEAVQTREWAKYLGDDRAAAAPPAWHDVRTFEDHVFLHAYGGLLPEIEFLTSGRTATSPDWHSQTTGGSTVDLACALTLLRARGLDAIALDLTTIDVAEAGYCVTKVFMPELQPLYADERQPFLGGSRLYDLPRRLGYTSRNTTLAELNSVPHPYP